MVPVDVKVPLDGSYNNAEFSHASSFWPPVINTLPEGSSVCAAPARLGESGMVACTFARPTPTNAKTTSSKDRRNDFFIVEQRISPRQPSKDEDPRLTYQTARSKFFQMIRFTNCRSWDSNRCLMFDDNDENVGTHWSSDSGKNMPLQSAAIICLALASFRSVSE
jgi:hypothetical protein